MNTVLFVIVAVLLVPQTAYFVSILARRRPAAGTPDRPVMEKVAAGSAAAFAPTLAEMASEGPPDEGVLRIKLEQVVEDAIARYVGTALPHPDDMPDLDPWDRRLVRETDDSRPSYAPADEPILLVLADGPKP